MRLVLITENFPPLRNSGAVQLKDIAREFVKQGHQITVLVPDSSISTGNKLEIYADVRVLRLKAPRTKDIGYLRRTLAELLMPFAMMRQLNQSAFANDPYDGVIWYSPSIFHAPLASYLKRTNRCKSYLIIRDIFPEWAVDMGLMRRGPTYLFFALIARYQYSVADVIGIQSSGNKVYFQNWIKKANRKLEVLPNWLGTPSSAKCSVIVRNTRLRERKIFIYAGNMGVAQGIDIFLDLAASFGDRDDIGFLFVGRGTEAARLCDSAKIRQLSNVVFLDEIDSAEIPGLYAQCTAGIVALDNKHRSHNIPGKFLTYMQSGLPVLANINQGNDLAKLIRDEKVGQVCESNQLDDLRLSAERLLLQVEADKNLPARCIALFEREYSVQKAVRQIVSSIQA